jgi:hypothetical protein
MQLYLKGIIPKLKSLFMKFVKYVVASFLLLFYYSYATAQYATTDFSIASKESSVVNIDKVIISPNKIAFDMNFYSSREGDEIMMSSQSQIQFPDFANKHYRISSQRGINGYLTAVTKYQKTNFSIGFNVSIFDLIESNTKTEKFLENFYSKGYITLDFINCNDAYRSANNISYGNCWDVYGLKVRLGVEKWNALYSYGSLEKIMKKDEFETSSDYAKRTSKDSLKAQLKAIIIDYETLCEGAFIYNCKAVTPGLTYNADEKTFIITYPGAEPAKIMMETSMARSFKERILKGTITLKKLITSRQTSGKFLIEKFYFKENGLQTEYKNTYTDHQEISRIFFETISRITTEVKSLQVENGAKAKLD